MRCGRVASRGSIAMTSAALRNRPISASNQAAPRSRERNTPHDMSAERRGAAVLDRRHHLQLAEAHMAGVGFAPRRSMVAEDIRDLQPWTRHVRRALGG